MKYTITDIANLAGVSKSTISRVLNNSKPVNKEIKERVLKVITETNYKPSQIARSLTNKETRLIGVIVPDLSNPIFSEVINGIEFEAIKSSYNILLCNSKNHVVAEKNILEILINKEIDGLIYNGFKVTEDIKQLLIESKIPVVMIGIDYNDINFPIVKIDNFRAAFDAAQYLIDNGHKNIGMIHGPTDDPFAGELRLNGFLEALSKNSIEANRDYIVEGKYKISSGYSAMTSILKNSKLPSAIFCANDQMAIGAIKCIKDNGLEVPKDISIIGFDNIEMSEIYSPSITTVEQPFFNKGMSAMELLIQMINKKDIPLITTHKHKIVVRETVNKI